MKIARWKGFRRFFALCCLLSALAYSSAQPRPRKNHHKELKTYQGDITHWEVNNDWIYNAFTLLYNTNETILVKFPSHLGSEIKALGEHDLKVNGYIKTNNEGVSFLHLISISNGKSEVSRHNDGPKRHHHKKKEPIAITSSGKIEEILYNIDNQSPTAYLLDNGTILKMPPHIFRQLDNIVKVGTKIEYQGLERRINKGELQSNRKTIVHARTIEINGTSYFIK